MLDQSFSPKNFRKIFDVENRKGNYLEAKYFPEVESLSQDIQNKQREYERLKQFRDTLTEAVYQMQSQEIGRELEHIKETKEQALTQALTQISDEALSDDFSIGITEIDIGTSKEAYTADLKPAAFFALKQIQSNIRRLYKVKQGNRHHIMCQLREILGDTFPKYIIRTDISSFYESIPREKLLKKLSKDTLLSISSKKIIRKVLYEYKTLSGNAEGLPRGIGLSAYLSELYMRDFDEAIQSYPGVIYYARYVDDIFIVYCPPADSYVFEFGRKLTQLFSDSGLQRNRAKTSIHYGTRSLKYSLEYLGYRIEYNSGKVVMGMTASKLQKYKQRIDRSIEIYLKQIPYSELQARRLLMKRLKFLSGNTRLVNNKKNVVAGIYFSNPLLSSDEIQDLEELDHHLNNKLTTIANVRLKKQMGKLSFKDGYNQKKFHKFSAIDLTKIVEVWKYDS